MASWAGSITASIAVVIFAACSSDATELACRWEPVQPLQAMLYHGSERAAVVAMTPRSAAAIALLLTTPGVPRLYCTGTFISREWVLTAAHCRYAERPIVQLGKSYTEPMSIKSSLEVVVHPEQDLMLLRVEPAAEVDPIPLLTEPVDSLWNGTMVQLSGFGVQEDGELGQLRFAAERITQANSAEIIVDGEGQTGACAGDSGGPLLVRGLRGSSMLAGVLTRGSQTCLGKDKYLPIHPVLPWIMSVIAAEAPSCEADSCDGDAPLSLCRGGDALWCEHGQLQRETCGTGRLCAWEATEQASRCIAAQDDPCRGIDEYGICDGDRALRCEHGELISTDCGACAQVCGRDQSTARVRCVTSDDPAM